MKRLVIALGVILILITSGCGSSKEVSTKTETSSFTQLGYSEAHDLHIQSMDKFQELVDAFTETMILFREYR